MLVDLQARLKAFSKLVSEQQLLDTCRLVWEHDRQFTSPAFHKTARRVTARMKQWKIAPEICHVPADGKTRFGDWTMPQGWDCTAARLSIVKPASAKGRVLADRANCPAHTVMWCGPTPPGGVVAPVVEIKDRRDFKKHARQLAGKIVFSSSDVREFKRELAEAGAAGVVTSFCRNAALIPDAVCWVNSWSDEPGDWAFKRGHAPLPGIVISPRQGQELSALLSRAPVTLKMAVDAKYIDTTLPVVSGFVPGKRSEEVLAIGHAMEQGVNDNASGCAIILESLRAIRKGAKIGAVAPLRRGVRGVLTNECYGTIGYAALNPAIMHRTLAAINWDSLARYAESTDAVYRHHRCADASASIADTLMVLLLETWLRQALPYARLRTHLPFALTDNAYNDPDIGVPCVYVDSQDRFWHTSADTFDQISGRALHAFTTISATWLHFLATAGTAEAVWLAQKTSDDYATRLVAAAGKYAGQLLEPRAAKSEILARGLDHLDYIGEIWQAALASAQPFMTNDSGGAGKRMLLRLSKCATASVGSQKRQLSFVAATRPAQRLQLKDVSDIAHLRPRKTFIGTPTYDNIPLKQRSKIGSPMWDARVTCALFWARGELSFAEIARRVGFEFDRDCILLLAKHFRFMARHGLIEWNAAKGK